MHLLLSSSSYVAEWLFMDESPSVIAEAMEVSEAFRLRLSDTSLVLLLLVMALLVVLAVVALAVVPPKEVRATMVLIKSECTDRSLCCKDVLRGWIIEIY